MDGNGTLFGTLAGNTRDVIHKFTVDLPKKHGRGGQSALRFSRLRDEKRHNYIRKVAELAVQHFITNDKVNVTGLVLAGSADFKTELSQSDMFDQRLVAKVIKVVDVSYGGENGFNQVRIFDSFVNSNHLIIFQAIELAAESLANVKFVQEKRLIQKYFDEISQDTGKYCFGIEDTLKALELGSIETLIVWENMDITRYILRNAAGGKTLFNFYDSLYPYRYDQRRSSYIATKSRRKTARNSWISPQASRWSKRRKLSLSLNGSPRSTRSLARTLNSSQTDRKKERSS
jgi:peptide chain release factor subunit 1